MLGYTIILIICIVMYVLIGPWVPVSCGLNVSEHKADWGMHVNLLFLRLFYVIHVFQANLAAPRNLLLGLKTCWTSGIIFSLKRWLKHWNALSREG